MKECLEEFREEEHTFLSIEEEECFVESKGVIIWWCWWRMVLGQSLGDDNGKTNDKESYENGTKYPFQCLVTHHYATKVHILLLSLINPFQNPAL